MAMLLRTSLTIGMFSSLPMQKALVALEIRHDDLEQVVGLARHHVAGDDFGQGENRLLERVDALVGVAVDLDPHEHREAEADTAALQHCAIALDVALTLQPLDAAQTRGRREADPLRQLDIAQATVGLECRDDPAVDHV